MFTGYTALCIARGAPGRGRAAPLLRPQRGVDGDRAPALGARGGGVARIDLRLGPALDTLRGAAAFDPAIDSPSSTPTRPATATTRGDLRARMRPSGLILFDNVLWMGQVLDRGGAATPTPRRCAGAQRLSRDRRARRGRHAADLRRGDDRPQARWPGERPYHGGRRALRDEARQRRRAGLVPPFSARAPAAIRSCSCTAGPRRSGSGGATSRRRGRRFEVVVPRPARLRRRDPGGRPTSVHARTFALVHDVLGHASLRGGGGRPRRRGRAGPRPALSRASSSRQCLFNSPMLPVLRDAYAAAGLPILSCPPRVAHGRRLLPAAG